MAVRFEEMFRGWLPAMAADQDSYEWSYTERMMPTQLRDLIAQLGLALSDEVHELVNEFQWKHWKGIEIMTFPLHPDSDRTKVAHEAVDVLHFVGHLLNIAGVNEDELNKAMYDKRLENERRQRSGYSY